MKWIRNFILVSLFFFFSENLFAQWHELPNASFPISYDGHLDCPGGLNVPYSILYPAGNGVIIYDFYCRGGSSEDYEILESMNDLSYDTSRVDIYDMGYVAGTYFNSFNSSRHAVIIAQNGISTLYYTSTNFASFNPMSSFIAPVGGPIAITNSFIYIASQSSFGYLNDSIFISQTKISANTCKHISSYKDSGLGKLVFINDSIGFLVSCHRGSPTTNRLLQTTNYGTTWNEFLYDSLHNITDYCFPSIDTGYVIFDHDSIFKTTNGGAIWNKLSVPTGNLTCIQFANGPTGYVGGKEGFLINTIDGGITWTTQNSTDTNTITSLYTFGTSIAYFVDNHKNIYKNQIPYDSPEADSNSVTLFPNPNKGTFSVLLKNCPSNTFIEIFNVLGQKIYSYSLLSPITEISLTNPIKGMYFYMLITPSEEIISKGKFILE